MANKEVDQSQLMRYIEIEKEVQQLEAQSVLKDFEVRNKAAVDVAETIKSVEITLKQLELQTKKEKQDVDNMQQKSIQDMFKDQATFDKELSREQEEYLEAKNKEEVARQQLQDLQKQHKDLEGKASEIKGPAEKLKKLYEERDSLLSDIFNGEYGSEVENKLEAAYDSLMDTKQRVSVAHYKWTSARVLLYHAVSQLSHSVQKWKELENVPMQQMQQRYTATTEVRNNIVASIQNIQSTQRYLNTIDFPYCKPAEMETLQRAANNIYTGIRNSNLMYLLATETRNNNIAAIANIRSCTRYLGDKIDFPYAKENEMATLERATENVYIDMADKNRHKHALQCYDVTWKRAAALLQWFDNVIANTIQKDLKKTTAEGRQIERDLRAERIRLIRLKIEESGGDVKGLNEADLKLAPDDTQLTEEDMDMKGLGITRPAPVGDDKGIPDASNDEPAPPAPTPLPLSELAPMPSESDLFGNISDLKEQYKKNTEEYMKTQDMNKARMEQGLQAKLAARRHKKTA